MKISNRRMRGISGLTLCLALAGGGAVLAQKKLTGKGQPAIKVSLSGNMDRKGERISLDKAEAVKPGEVINWMLSSVNEGNGVARDYKAVSQIPIGTSFISGSAVASGASVSYSIDGGQTFSAQPTVEEKQADGSSKRVPASASSFTQVRYEWSTPLDAGQTLSASYQVRVK